MSYRTVIEINHDFLHELRSDPGHFAALLSMLNAGVGANIKPPGTVGLPGIRVIGQRHHSETLSLTVE